jgi:hypothetical protein
VMSVLGDVSDKGYPRNLQGLAKTRHEHGRVHKIFILIFDFQLKGRFRQVCYVDWLCALLGKYNRSLMLQGAASRF